jgi:DNA-binding NarL/FixJ family response regulator
MTVSPVAPWRPPHWPRPETIASITGRQAEVLDGLCDGLSNKQIAARLFITEMTVKTHVKGLLAALGARDRTHAAVLAITGQVVIHVRGYYEPARRSAA